MAYLNQNFTYFSADYGCGAYGAGTYNAAGVCGASTETGGGLANTGLDVWLPLGAGSLMIVISTVYFGAKLFRKKKLN